MGAGHKRGRTQGRTAQGTTTSTRWLPGRLWQCTAAHSPLMVGVTDGMAVSHSGPMKSASQTHTRDPASLLQVPCTQPHVKPAACARRTAQRERVWAPSGVWGAVLTNIQASPLAAAATGAGAGRAVGGGGAAAAVAAASSSAAAALRAKTEAVAPDNRHHRKYHQSTALGEKETERTCDLQQQHRHGGHCQAAVRQDPPQGPAAKGRVHLVLGHHKGVLEEGWHDTSERPQVQ
jgi:hypothetical protein